MTLTLPTWQDLKPLIKAQTAVEDGGSGDNPAGTGNGLLARMVERAAARVENFIKRPLLAEEQTMIDRALTSRAFEAVDRILIPMSPVSGSPAPVITDKDGVVVDATTYTIDLLTGIVYANDGVTFQSGPYTIVATVGLSAHPRAAKFWPDIQQNILDVAVDLYGWREPANVDERAGGGVGKRREDNDGVPKRVAYALRQYRRMGWA